MGLFWLQYIHMLYHYRMYIFKEIQNFTKVAENKGRFKRLKYCIPIINGTRLANTTGF